MIQGQYILFYYCSIVFFPYLFLSFNKVCQEEIECRENTVCLAPSAQLVALQRVCFSYLRNRMQFRSSLAELWFDTLPKCLTHLQELSEYILLLVFSLIISSHFVSLSFCFTPFEKGKNRFHKEVCGDDKYLQFLLKLLGIEFIFTLIHILSLYVLSTWNIHPFPYFCWKNPHLGQRSKNVSGAKI